MKKKEGFLLRFWSENWLESKKEGFLGRDRVCLDLERVPLTE